MLMRPGASAQAVWCGVFLVAGVSSDGEQMALENLEVACMSPLC